MGISTKIKAHSLAHSLAHTSAHPVFLGRTPYCAFFKTDSYKIALAHRCAHSRTVYAQYGGYIYVVYIPGVRGCAVIKTNKELIIAKL